MSSSDIALSVKGLSKSYTIAHNAVKHSTAGEALMHRLRNPFHKPERETFWALQDVDFDIQRGDVVGIIGRNGAGKSTLLKILSRITEPTKGEINLYGRVGSLLEVGTGFHQELTGRENIYLNGAILGMSRREIAKQFDAIVDFAGVEQFLDTPVKRYSSGMYVRLAFAVAAHLNPEILIVDEVLAVGDAEFQKKCLGKMKDVANSGRTVLFVSHNMDAVRTLCSRGLILHKGSLVSDQSIERCLEVYLAEGYGFKNTEWRREADAPESALIVTSVNATLCGEQPRHNLEVDIELLSQSDHKPAFIAIDIAGPMGGGLMQVLPTIEGFIDCHQREHQVRVNVDLPPMVPGNYSLTIWAGDHNTNTLDEIKGCVGFEVVETPTKNRTFPHTPDHGYIVPSATVSYDTQRLTFAA